MLITHNVEATSGPQRKKRAFIFRLCEIFQFPASARASISSISTWFGVIQIGSAFPFNRRDSRHDHQSSPPPSYVFSGWIAREPRACCNDDDEISVIDIYRRVFSCARHNSRWSHALKSSHRRIFRGARKSSEIRTRCGYDVATYEETKLNSVMYK